MTQIVEASQDDRHEGWYVAQVKPGANDLAERNLARQGFHAVMPRLLKMRRVGARQIQVRTPLFPGYVFIDPQTVAQSWRPINSTLGISRLLTGQGGRPARLPAGFVAALLRGCDEAGVFAGRPALNPGDTVEVVVDDDVASDLPAEVARDVGRVVEEGLGNAVRHGGATSVAVHVRRSDGEVVVEVEDDGRGPTGGPPGLGSSLLDSVSRTWELHALPTGARLTVRIAPGIDVAHRSGRTPG